MTNKYIFFLINLYPKLWFDYEFIKILFFKVFSKYYLLHLKLFDANYNF